MLKYLIFFTLSLVFISCEDDTVISDFDATISFVKNDFIGSESCKECHTDEYNKWKGSHHDLAMQIADSNTILADFNDTQFSYNGVKSTFFIQNGVYYVNTEGPDGKNHDYKIEYTFGVTPLQQYIVKFPDGAYQCLQTAWDVKKEVWYDLQPDLEIKHNEWIHWTGGGMKWNTMCADCHSTNVNKNYTPSNHSYNTTYSEINTGCESCHGPSSNHVDFYRTEDNTTTPPEMYMHAGMESTELVEKCARCHSRRSQITNAFNFTEEYLDHYEPSLLTTPNYHPDGQINGEVYVYGSFIQSKMFHNDVSCKDCHDVHTLKLKAEGNQLCLSCHEPQYDSEAHHFHSNNNEGTQCINCHMVSKTYMGNDVRRDHSFRVPRPDQSVKYGTPNACNECHTNKTAQWAMDEVIKNYGNKRADHFSEHLLAGYNGDMESLKHLITSGVYPNLARATAANYFANSIRSEEDLAYLSALLENSPALVKLEVLKAFERNGSPKAASYIAPFLTHPLRSLRISAAGYYTQTNQIPDKISDLNNAKTDYLISMDVNADFAAGQLKIALYNERIGNTQKAIEAYKKSILLDNYYNQSRMNLALLYYNQGNLAEAEKLYLDVIKFEPDYSQSYYMLGLLYNEKADLLSAKKYLAASCERQPFNPNAFYNYSLLLQGDGEIEASLNTIEEGLKVVPYNEKLLYLKLTTLLNLKRFNEAYPINERLIAINPNNSDYIDIKNKLENLH